MEFQTLLCLSSPFSFYTEDGLELDELNYNTEIKNNDTILIVPSSKKYSSSVKLNKYDYISVLKNKLNQIIYYMSIVKDVITNKIYYKKRIECSSIGKLILTL